MGKGERIRNGDKNVEQRPRRQADALLGSSRRDLWVGLERPVQNELLEHPLPLYFWATPSSFFKSTIGDLEPRPVECHPDGVCLFYRLTDIQKEVNAIHAWVKNMGNVEVQHITSNFQDNESLQYLDFEVSMPFVDDKPVVGA
eukprot:385443-Pelagomonas_calceolata.AAC.11